MQKLSFTKEKNIKTQPKHKHGLYDLGADHELLDHKQEIELANRVKLGDVEARDRLFKANVRFVISIAKKYSNAHLSLVDLIQEGNIGLMTAIDKYDPDKGYRFTTHAYWWIRQAITRSIQKHGQVVKIPVYAVELASKLRKAANILSNAHGHNFDIADLADVLELDVVKVKALFDATYKCGSIDQNVSKHDGRLTLKDVIQGGDNLNPYSIHEERDMQKQIRYILKTLPLKEEAVLRMRFGFE